MQKRIYSFALLSRRGIMAAMRLNRSSSPDGKTPDPNTGNPAGRTPCRTRYGCSSGTGNSRPAPNGPPPWRPSEQGPQSGAADRAQPGLPGLRRAAGAAARARWRAPCWWRRQTWNAPTPRTVCAASRRSPDLAALPERGGGQRQRSLLPPGARARLFAEHWGSRLVVVPGAGHINADSGLGDWPQGLKLLGALRRRSSWRVSPPPERISPVPVRPLSHQG